MSDPTPARHAELVAMLSYYGLPDYDADALADKIIALLDRPAPETERVAAQP